MGLLPDKTFDQSYKQTNCSAYIMNLLKNKMNGFKASKFDHKRVMKSKSKSEKKLITRGTFINN